MKPLGRKYFKCNTGSKHHVKDRGKYSCWWDDICTPSKRLEQRLVQKEIEQGVCDAEDIAYLHDYLDEDYILPIDTCCNEENMCGDGLCPVCNLKEYRDWLYVHRHCDQETWDYPEEDNYPCRDKLKEDK